VKNLNQGDIRIVIHGKRFSILETGHATIRFFARHASYFEQPKPRSYKTYWGFDVEEKLFLSSNHSTKISFVAGQTDAETAAKRKKVEEFIDKIMAEASMKPIPRFTLKNRIG